MVTRVVSRRLFVGDFEPFERDDFTKARWNPVLSLFSRIISFLPYLHISSEHTTDMFVSNEERLEMRRRRV